MEQTKRRNGSFIAFEYKEVTADITQASFLMDGYANFGWEIDENVMPVTAEKYSANNGTYQHRKIVIRLKRDRRILNKMELTRLQRNFEACVAEIGESGERKNIPSIHACSDSRYPGYGIYGRFYICSDGAASAYPVVYYSGSPGLPGLDPSVFPVQSRRQTADREDNASD